MDSEASNARLMAGIYAATLQRASADRDYVDSTIALFYEAVERGAI
jgi:hypothetical protein